MDEALFRFLIDCKDYKDKKRVATNCCVVLVIGCVAFLLGMGVIQVLFAPDSLIWIICLVLSSTLLQITAALLRGFGRTAEFALMSFAASVTSIVLNVVLIAFMGMGVEGMLYATVIGQSFISLVFLVKEKIWQYIDIHALSKPCFLELVVYSLPLIPNKVSWTTMNMLDRLIIMNTIGADSAGIYAVAYKFPSVMDTVYGFFYQAWKESTARALGSEEDQDEFYDSVYRVLKRFMMSIVLCMVALLPVAYGLLVNGEYSEGLRYVPILLVATYYSNMSGFYGGIFTAYKDTRIMGTTTVASAVLCVVLCIFLIPRFGLYGAAVSTVIAIFAVNEYRRHKVSAYVTLSEDLREKAVTSVTLIGVLILYYISLYTACWWMLVPCLVISLVYSIVMNGNLIRAAAARFKKTNPERD
jgi:O-antigen/teichoic acid export membrane protein